MQAVYIFWGIVCFLVPVSSYARDVIYTVRNGDTLFSLSRAFMVQSEELMARNGISDPQKLRVGQQLIIPSAQNHPVVWGDTLSGIAFKYDIPEQVLREANKLSANYVLKVGDILIIPGQAPRTEPIEQAGGTSAVLNRHTVVWGDTLSGIAFKYDIPEQVLREANKLSANYVLKVGDILIIPGQAPRTEPIEQAGGTSADSHRHTVVWGDTLSGIAFKYDIPEQVLREANKLSANYVLKVGDILTILRQAPRTEPIEQAGGTSAVLNRHTVVWGDTLSGIAFKYDIPEQVLREANKLSANYVLKVGDTLTIPRQAPRTEPIEQAGGLSAALNRHTVVRGETLYGIARTYSIPEQVLREANKLSANYVLKVGDILTIPGQAPRTEPIEQTARTSSQREHTVVRGETILGIALAYGIPEQALRSANKLSANYVLKVGDTLTIPQQSYSTPVSQQARPSNVSARNQQWPVSAREIRSVSGKISGVLLSGDRGETVYAIRAGTVISAGPYSGYGKVVIIDSPNGYTYTYACLDVLTVKVGDTVTPGLSLGTLGQQRLLFLVYDAHGTAVDPATAPRG